MFFWKMKFKHFLINSFKASLRACHYQIDPNTSDIISNPKRITNRISKRTFFLAPSEYQASMCLEASLSFSFFLLFLVNIFSIISLFMTYTQDLISLQQQGKKAAAYAYVTEGLIESNEELIRLEKVEVIKSPFTLLAAPDCPLHIKCVVKPWTGYDVTGGKKRDEEEALVFMTEYGTVYHKNRSCSHLSLSIQAVTFDKISEYRNESGERYYPCEYCGEDSFITIAFITSHGNRYHTSTKCQGLKRMVKSMPLSEVEGVSPCKKCG